MRFTPVRHGADKKILCVDIGSSRIACAYIEMTTGAKPHILATSRHELPVPELFSSTRFLQKLDAGIRESVASLRTQVTLKPDSVSVTLSPLFYAHQIRTVHASYTEATKITTALLKTIVESESRQFQEETRHTSMLDEKIMQIRLNGYTVHEPEEKMATTLDLRLYFSALDTATDRVVRDAIACALHTSPLQMHAASFAAWRVFDTTLHFTKYLSIIIEGETTTVQHIQDGAIIQSISFPYGKNTILRSIMRSQKTTPFAAASLLRLSLDDKGHELGLKALRATLATEAAQWKKLLFDAVVMLHSRQTVPPVLLLAEDTMMPFFSSACTAKDLAAHMQATHTPDVRLVTTGSLDGYCTYSGEAQKENYLMLAVLFSATL